MFSSEASSYTQMLSAGKRLVNEIIQHNIHYKPRLKIRFCLCNRKVELRLENVL